MLDDDEYLDALLEKFKRGPNDPKPSWALSSENLLEEMEQVPLFMTQNPSDAPGNVAIEALKSLMYDGSPEEIATNFKNNGNEHFKANRLDDALAFYSKGLEIEGCPEPIRIDLLLNRAATHLKKGIFPIKIENYGWALKDCKEALSLDSSLLKAYFRASKAFLAMGKLEAALQSCKKAFELDKTNQETANLKKVISAKLAEACKMEEEKKSKQLLESILMSELKARQVFWRPRWTHAVMLPCPREQLPFVHFDAESQQAIKKQMKISSSFSDLVASVPRPLHLIWPVLFIYPFYQLTDFISQFHENDCFAAHLETVLFPTPKWDTYQKFKDKNSIKIFYRHFKMDKSKASFSSEDTSSASFSSTLVQVNSSSSLRDVLSNGFVVSDGIPAFYIVRLVSEIPK